MFKFPIKKIIISLIKLAAFVVAPLFIFIFSMYPDSIKNTVIELTISWALIIITIYFIILLAFYSWTTSQENKTSLKETIKDLKIENSQLKSELANISSGLWKELKFLNKYKEQEVLSITLERFIKNHEEVVSAQIYEYYFQKSPFIKNHTTIKLTHVEGIAKEGENQNAVMQAYYRIPTTTLKFFYDVRKMLRNYSEYPYTHQKNTIHRAALLFAKRQLKILGRKNQDALNKVDVFRFSLLKLLLEDLGLSNNIDIPHEKFLYSLQKNGILRGIINDAEFYQFKYENKKNSNNEKFNRHYLTKKILVNESTHILVISLNNEISSENSENIGADLVHKLFESDLVVEYNY